MRKHWHRWGARCEYVVLLSCVVPARWDMDTDRGTVWMKALYVWRAATTMGVAEKQTVLQCLGPAINWGVERWAGTEGEMLAHARAGGGMNGMHPS